MVTRLLDSALQKHFITYKEVLVLLGARQVGKTTILKRIFPDAQYYSVDSDPIKNTLEKFDPAVYQQIIKPDPKIIIFDEIQRLSDPGRAAKIIYDSMPEYRLIITGSSSFDIKNKTSESLAGRKIEYRLFPLTFGELLVQNGVFKEFSFLFLGRLLKGEKLKTDPSYPVNMQAILDNTLTYGLYPGVISHPGDEIYLKNLVDSVIFKDLLDLSLIGNRKAALDLLQLLAYQVGSLVNVSEIASRLAIDVKTVKRYISLFEQSFIIFSLLPYSNRKRSEIGKMPKIYFYDVGLRNALIDNFQSLYVRSDSGAIFENFIISEVYKLNHYGNFGFKMNYWRTKQGSEVDLVISLKNNRQIAVEIKSKERSSGVKAFTNHYPEASFYTVTKDNFFQ